MLKYCLFLICTFILFSNASALDYEFSEGDTIIKQLENPVTAEYLKKNLRKQSPRLVFTPAIEKELRKRIKSDDVVANYYKAIIRDSREILSEPVLTRVIHGRRMLGTSREMLYRMNILGMVYRIEKDKSVLDRINKEVLAVCNFVDWNPSHFLDVAEMAMAVAIAIDWTAGDLPRSTSELAKTALIEKAINPGFKPEYAHWVNEKHNWNQVCHGGLIAAAIAIAEKDPELAARTISRALDGMVHALNEYFPDGVYPEGATYWSYGTGFSVLTISMFESAFGTDFGIAAYPGFLESAVFRIMTEASSGWYYNFADCGDRRGKNGDLILAWFAAKTGNKRFLEKERFLLPPDQMRQLSREAGAGLIWLSQYNERENIEIPEVWKGGGANPVVIFKSGENDPHKYYLGAKGGKGIVNHGNMDAGSFVFELNGIRWVIDPGNQDYNDLEEIGFDLWNRCQDCERWTLLTKNNFGHSTISVNNAHHKVDGMAEIIELKTDGKPEAVIDLSPAFEGQLKSLKRKFIKDSQSSLIIKDEIITSAETNLVTWQLMTTAEINLIPGGAILKQDNKELELSILSHPDLMISVISLDPPPIVTDRRIKSLKRLEIRMPAYLFEEGQGTIVVRLAEFNHQ